MKPWQEAGDCELFNTSSRLTTCLGLTQTAFEQTVHQQLHIVYGTIRIHMLGIIGSVDSIKHLWVVLMWVRLAVSRLSLPYCKHNS